MAMKKLLLLGALLLGIASPAIAQTTTQVTGTTVLHGAVSPGGTGYDYTLDSVRNGTQFVATTQTGAATSTASGGTLMWIGTAPTTWAVTLPSSTVAYPGQKVTLTTDTTLTSMVTVTAGSGNTLHATYNSQTLTALTPVVFQYQKSTLTWFRIQ